MIVKVSRPMTKLIKEALQGIAASVKIEKYTVDQYSRLVDYELIKHTTDFDGLMFKVIKVNYSPDCYALPAYITTWDLHRAYTESDGTLEGFTRTIRSQYAI